MSLENEWDRYIAFIRKHKDQLNDWERGFVINMWKRRQTSRDLNLRQSFKLREIHHQIEFRVG